VRERESKERKKDIKEQSLELKSKREREKVNNK